MIALIDKFDTTITENNGTITVHYKYDTLSGTCEYRIVEVNNRFKQKAWLMINSDMGDVIEFIHTNMPLKSEDLIDVSKLIRDHSLSRVKKINP